MPVHLITEGDASCHWFKCNPLKLIKGQQWMKPLCARDFPAASPFVPKRSEVLILVPSAPREKKPLVPRVLQQLIDLECSVSSETVLTNFCHWTIFPQNFVYILTGSQRGGGSLARFTTLKYRGSRFTNKRKLVFPNHENKKVRYSF